jgi:hypothetical protein
MKFYGEINPVTLRDTCSLGILVWYIDIFCRFRGGRPLVYCTVEKQTPPSTIQATNMTDQIGDIPVYKRNVNLRRFLSCVLRSLWSAREPSAASGDVN